jgi:molecular chaperone HtpG
MSSDHMNNQKIDASSPMAFKAETKQLLNILVHSLYTEREIFLRELISNASDALMRVEFEMLTNRDVVDSQSLLEIRVIPNNEEGTLTITDTGIGMTADELVENLGTIAHSGARAFVEAVKEDTENLSDVIGQFGVGFYSAFMVADWIKVVSKSFKDDSDASSWYSDGSDTFTVTPETKEHRGTSVIIKFNSDATEFLEEHRLKTIIAKHSDFIAYPIFIGDNEEQVNRQTALWRQQSHQVEATEYEEFYKQLTRDFDEPLAHSHLVVDAPVQMYALLFIPNSPERHIFSSRKEDGLQLYSRKVLIQDYCKDLLPEYFSFVEGVVDSEDIPLNVSRESVQATRIMVNLKKVVTSKVIDTLKKLAKDDRERYDKFWEAYGRHIKQGVATEQNEPETLYTLLRFRTTSHPDTWVSLEGYVHRIKPDQKEIYFILGDDDQSVLYSPHLDVVKHYGYDVLLFTDPLDAFMLPQFTKYGEYNIVNVATAELVFPEDEKMKSDDEISASLDVYDDLISRIKSSLGDRVSDVRITERLSDSPARLIDTEGAPNQEMQRVYRLIDKDFEVPKKVLEINPRHPIIIRLNEMPNEGELVDTVIVQIYEDTLLIEGLHPDPAGMIPRIQKLIEAAMKN